MAKNKTKNKNKKHPLRVLATLGIGSVLTVGALAGAFFASPKLQSNIADKLVDKSPTYQDVLDENETLKDLNNEKEKQIKVLTSDIQTKADTITGLNLQLTNVKKEKNNLEINLSNMVLDKENMLQTIKEKDGKIDGYTIIITNLNTQLSTVTQERDDIQSQLNGEIEKSDELVARLNDKNNEINSLNSVINSLTIQIDALKAIKEDYETKYLNSLNEINSLKEQIVSKDSEIEILNKRIVSLNEQIVLLQTELNSMQASSTCNIQFTKTHYSHTPDGPGYIWVGVNNENLMTYDFSSNPYAKSCLLNRLKSKYFDGLQKLDYYDLSIDSINYHTTFYKEYEVRTDENSQVDYKIVDALGNEITNFDNMTNKINIGLKVEELEIEKVEETSLYRIVNIKARLVLINNYQIQQAYSCGDNTLVLSDNNTFNYNGITGTYTKNYSEIHLSSNDDLFNKFCYLASDYSLVMDDELYLTENAHSISSSIIGEGKISLNPSSAKLENETVELTCTAESGYLVKSVSVCDEDGNIISVKNTGGTYSFTMPNKDVKIVVQFELYTLTFNANYVHYFDEVNEDGLKTSIVNFSENGTMTILTKDINSQTLTSLTGTYVIDENNIIATIPSTETGEYELVMYFEIVDSGVIVSTSNNMTYSCI